MTITSVFFISVVIIFPSVEGVALTYADATFIYFVVDFIVVSPFGVSSFFVLESSLFSLES